MKGPFGVRSSKDKGTETVWSDSQRPFSKVDYESKAPSIDFFRSIGRLPYPALIKNWYTDENGGKSICATGVLDNEIKWRNAYWERFSKACSIKLKEWEYEKEQRLTLSGMMLDYSNKEDRKLKFKFSSLDGIVFGMRTPIEKRIEIAKIVEKKCIEEKRTDFKFYESSYDHRTGKIQIHEMNAITFKLDP